MKTKEQAYKRLKEIIPTHTYREVAEVLNAEGYRTPQGLKWNRQHVATWKFNNRKASGKPAARKRAPTAKQAKVLSPQQVRLLNASLKTVIVPLKVINSALKQIEHIVTYR